ncbi:uncharacterized protein LOC132711348 [Pantherophis guttatus]|uniref:Uncharacterized protein LOC132711348 n=1 Tax=Pantherophis guttatus TaxID=94885 RepID=A0ABM3ZCE7_PANGU|nr:uncharacterized protein LOC132711348 [Pantherophis guttatus]
MQYIEERIISACWSCPIHFALLHVTSVIKRYTSGINCGTCGWTFCTQEEGPRAAWECGHQLGRRICAGTGHARSSFRAGVHRVRFLLLELPGLGLGLSVGGWTRPRWVRRSPLRLDTTAGWPDPRRRRGEGIHLESIVEHVVGPFVPRRRGQEMFQYPW